MNRKIFYPRIGQSILLLLMGVGLQLVTGLIIGIVFIAMHLSQESLTMVSLAAAPFCTLLAALFGVYRSKVSFRKYIANMLDSKISLVFCFFFFIGVYFLTLFLGSLLETILPSNDSLDSLFIQGFNSWIGIVAIVVLAPIFEELLFRGVLLRGFLKNYSVPVSLILTSVMFGVFHLNLSQGITATILGLALGWIFIKTGSLWVTILFHALNNGLSTLLYHLSTSYNIQDSTMLWIMLAAVVLGGISAFMLVRKPNNISHIMAEKDEGLRQRAEYERQQAEMMAAMQAAAAQNYPYGYPPQGYGNNQYGTPQPGMPQYNMEQYDMYNQNYMQYGKPSKHSGLGISSFIISVSVGLLEICMLIWFIVSSRTSNQIISGAAIMYGLAVMLGTIANLAGLGLGIAGALQKNRKKVFSILGIVINSLAILAFIIILVVGLSAQQYVPQMPMRGFKF